MKKLIATIIALFAFLIFAFFSQQKQGANKQTKPVVGILQTMSHPALDQIHRGVVAGLKKAGYINGKNIQIIYENAQNDQSNLKTMSDNLQNKNAAVVIGIATPAVQALANESGNTPVIMGAVSDPLASGLIKSMNHPQTKVTGVQDKQPIGAQLDLIKEIMPTLKNIGIIYTSSDDSSTTEAKEFKTLAQKAGLKVKAYTVTSTNDIDQVAQTMVNKVQAVYVPTDNTIASGFSSLLKIADAAQIPIFPAADTMVNSGGVATRSVSQFDMGVLTGKMAAAILKGQDPATYPIQRVTHYQTTINLKQAKKLQLKIPQSLLRQASQKGKIIK